MPSPRDREKADATRTPLADLAPAMPPRPVDEAPDVPITDDRATNATRIPDDDRLPESPATKPAAGPEGATAPVNVRARPRARAIAARAALPAVPRTIAEMQAVDRDAADTASPADVIAPEAAPAPLFVSVRALLLGAFLPFALLTLAPALFDLLGQAIGLSGVARSIANFVVIAAAAVGVFALGLRLWRIAFHDVPSDLHPRAALALWERRAADGQRDLWTTASLWILGGFILMVLLTLAVTPFSYGIAAAYIVPYLLLLLVTKAIGAFLFVGYLERGLLARTTPARAALLTGALYAAALAIANFITIAASDLAAFAELALPYLLVSVAVGLGAAWIRLRARSLLVAIAFQLLLLLLGFRV